MRKLTVRERSLHLEFDVEVTGFSLAEIDVLLDDAKNPG
jgi:hypothetical protein